MFAQADDDGCQNSLGSEDEEMDEEGDQDHHPAPTSLGVVVLLQGPQLP